jgi:hypothetical protein
MCYIERITWRRDCHRQQQLRYNNNPTLQVTCWVVKQTNNILMWEIVSFQISVTWIGNWRISRIAIGHSVQNGKAQGMRLLPSVVALRRRVAHRSIWLNRRIPGDDSAVIFDDRWGECGDRCRFRVGWAIRGARVGRRQPDSIMP